MAENESKGLVQRKIAIDNKMLEQVNTYIHTHPALQSRMDLVLSNDLPPNCLLYTSI